MKSLFSALLLSIFIISPTIAAEKILMTPEEYTHFRYQNQNNLTHMLNASNKLDRMYMVNEGKRLARAQNKTEAAESEVNIEDIGSLSDYFNKKLYKTTADTIPYHLIDTSKLVQEEEQAWRQRRAQAKQKSEPIVEAAPQPEPAPQPAPSFRQRFSR